MGKYIAVIYGIGEGCDYTIACNQTIKIVEAENEQEVLQKVLEDYDQIEDRVGCKAVIDNVEIYELKNDGVQFNNLADKFYKEKEIYKNKLKEKNDRELYEKLKRKFG